MPAPGVARVTASGSRGRLPAEVTYPAVDGTTIRCTIRVRVVDASCNERSALR